MSARAARILRQRVATSQDLRLRLPHTELQALAGPAPEAHEPDPDAYVRGMLLHEGLRPAPHDEDVELRLEPGRAIAGALVVLVPATLAGRPAGRRAGRCVRGAAGARAAPPRDARHAPRAAMGVTSAAPTHAGAVAARPAAARAPRGPFLAMAGGALLVAVCAAAVGLRVTGYALDETLFQASAVHYTHGLPESVFNDLTARATSRLYALTLMPLFAAFEGDTALALAKLWNAILFSSAVVPAYLLSRFVIRSPWRAAASALLCIALPWVTLTTALFTESLAYPAALWLAWAMAWAVRDPAPRRDLLVLALAGLAVVSRVQLVAMFGAYVLMVGLLAAFATQAGGSGRERADAAWRYVRRFPFSLAIFGIAVLVALALASRGGLTSRVDDLVGSYGEFQHRTTVPADVPMAALIEVASLAAGVGIVPFIVALAWYPAALRDRSDPAARALAATAVAATFGLFTFTIAAQSGFIGPITEERYFFYVVPFAWIAAIAATERVRASATSIAWSGALVAVLYGTIELPYKMNQELFLAPAGKSIDHLSEVALNEIRDALGKGGLTGRDLLFAVAAVLAVALAVAWRRAPWLRRWLIAGAAAFQVVLTGYALLAIDGAVAGGAADRTAGPTLGERGWIDAAATAGDVAILRNAVWRPEDNALPVLRDVEFYNSKVRRRVGVPALVAPTEQAPVDALPLTDSDVLPDGGFRPELAADEVVSWRHSPFLQLAGRRVAASPLGQPVDLLAVEHPARATWLATGLRSDGAVVPEQQSKVKLQAWPAGGAAKVRMALQAPGGPGAVRITLGDRRRDVYIGPGGTVIVELPLCGERVTGAIKPTLTSKIDDGSIVAALVRSVRVVPAGDACGR
ncbi:MAG: hypothetical protein HZB46_10130 [Solirubrobacterales bacterium]|nr:hypothetical protein [Solirubrobacterales bacterium]